MFSINNLLRLVQLWTFFITFRLNRNSEKIFKGGSFIPKSKLNMNSYRKIPLLQGTTATHLHSFDLFLFSDSHNSNHNGNPIIKVNNDGDIWAFLNLWRINFMISGGKKFFYCANDVISLLFAFSLRGVRRSTVAVHNDIYMLICCRWDYFLFRIPMENHWSVSQTT